MFNTTLKKTGFIFIGLVLVIGLGYLGWQRKHPIKAVLGTVASCTFSDVPLSHPQQPYIFAACIANIVTGYSDGTFKPENLVTHDQVAVVIARALAGKDGVPAATTRTYCAPISSTFWAYKEIEYLVSKKVLLCLNPQRCCAVNAPSGTVQSCGTGCRFSPGLNVNRALISVYLARAIAGEESKIPAGPTTATFKDVPTTVAYYKHVEYLYKMGVASGYADGTFHPAENVTRAQLAQLVAKAFDLMSTALVANVSGRVTTNTSAPLVNAYLVFDEGKAIVQTDANGNFSLEGLDATIYEVEIYDSTGRLYESSDLNNHLTPLNYGQQTINFSGLVPK